MYLIFPLLLAACAAEDEEVQEIQEVQNETTAVDSSEEDTAAVENDTNKEMIVDENASSVSDSTEDSSADSDASNSSASPVQAQGMEPSRLVIPVIDVDASIDGYGLDADGKMEVPDEGESIAWFERGAKPGAQGNAVLAGHVDDQTGPAVFYDLKELEQGDEIIVEDEAGASLTYRVTHKEAYPYDDAPIDRVFGPTSSRSLNLITCTGEFDSDVGTHRERLVVFTELVDDTV